MDIEKAWNQALKGTEIIRSRVAALETAGSTRVPYVLLAESSINVGDTIVRRGEVVVDKPSIILPPNNPQFNGFELDDDQSFDETSMVNFLLVRGISLPSLNYNNRTSSLDIFEGGLSDAIKHYTQDLQRKEDVHTGLIKGLEDAWPLSVLIFVCSQVTRNVDIDIRRLMQQYKNDS